MTARDWLARRSLRLRVTAISTIALTLGLALGAAGLSSLFVRARVAAVDVSVDSVVRTVSSLAATGELPSPLPVPAGGTALAQVIDAGGTVLAATPGASRVLPILSPAVIDAEGGGRRFTTTRSALGPAPLRVAIEKTTYRGIAVNVVVAVPFADVRDTLLALRRVVFVVVPLVVLAVALATWLAVGSALRPVDELRAGADAVVASPSATGAELPVPAGADEIRRLGETLNRMLNRLHRSNERQREFIANAAHELRSPIASVRTQLEVALSTPTEPDRWPVIVGGALDDVARLSALADDLLLLARLDSGAADALRSRPVDITELVGQPGPPVIVSGDPAALRRLFDNLVTNARRFADDVQVDVTQTNGRVVVTVDDDGPGIPEADRARVFDRWVRLDEARSRSDGGAGLGLAIARSVATAHGGDVALSDSPLGGLRATVTLPASFGSDGVSRAAEHLG